MAKSLEDILSEAAKGAKNINALTKSIKDLNAAKKTFLAAGDPKSILAIQKMIKSLEELVSVTESYDTQLQVLKKAQQENRDLTEEEIKALEKSIKTKDKAEENAKRTHSSFVKNAEERKRYNDQFEADALRYFRTYTLVGKAYTGVTEALSRYTAGLTFGSLVQKAWHRHLQTSEVQQNILIQSYKGFQVEQSNATLATDKLGKSLSNVSDKEKKNILDTFAYTKATLNLSTAIAKTEATAIKMGVSTEYVGDAFTKFARITGSQNALVLKTLSEGAITVSRSLGITVPEAIDFVSTRMDKFGGSAASAIASMYSMQKAATDTNKEFGRTVIRGDDVVRTIQDISKQTTIYGIDQRFVGNILRENVARLQASGKSYDAAQRQAKAFTEAVTGKAPEWMQVYSSFDVSSQLVKNFNGKELNAGMKKELEAAKPGLSAEVEKLLKESGGKLTYSVKRALGEMTSGTTVGIGAMNKQILKLAKHPEGLVLISKQFGVSLADAVGMVDAAKALEQKQKAIANITAKKVAYDKFTYNIDNKEIKLNDLQIKQMKEIDASSQSDADKAAKKQELLESIYQQKNDEMTVEKDRLRLQAEEENNLKQIGKINKYIADAQKQKAEFQKKLAEATDEKTKTELQREIARIDKMVAGKELERSRYESKSAEEKGKAEGLKTVEDINRELLNQFSPYADTTGKSLNAIVQALTDTKGLLIAAGVVGATRWALSYVGFSRIEKNLAMQCFLAKSMDKSLKDIASKGGVGGGGGGGGGGGLGGDETGVGAGGDETKDIGMKKEGFLSKLKKKAGGAAKKSKAFLKTGKGKTALAAAAAATIAAGVYYWKKKKDEEKEKEAKVEEKPEERIPIEGPPKMAGLGAMPEMGGKEESEEKETEEKQPDQVDTLLSGAQNLSGMASMAAGFLGRSAKLTKALPLVGNVVAGGIALKGAWDLWEKYKRNPKSISRKDKVKMAMQLGGMIPGIGNMIAIADIASDTKGVYDKMDSEKIDPVKTLKSKTSALAGAKIPSDVAKKITTALPEKVESLAAKKVDESKPIEPTTGIPVGKFTEGPNADGSITLKIENFMAAYAQAQTMVKQKTQR